MTTETALPRVELFGVEFSRVDLQGALDSCVSSPAGTSGGRYACFVNVHTLMDSTRDGALFRALKGAWLLLPDGVPIVWATRLRETPLPARVCGPDFMEALLSNHWSEPHGFIGGLPGQAEEIAARFKLSSQVSYCSPMRPFSVENAREDWDMFLARCPGRKPPRFIWVGLGAPKQEFWVEAISHLAPDSIFFAIGAAFDFHSGRKKRAPAWMQKSGLEWLYRLSTEPRRLGSRYLRTNSAFILKLGSTWFGSGSTGRGRH